MRHAAALQAQQNAHIRAVGSGHVRGGGQFLRVEFQGRILLYRVSRSKNIALNEFLSTVSQKKLLCKYYRPA